MGVDSSRASRMTFGQRELNHAEDAEAHLPIYARARRPRDQPVLPNKRSRPLERPFFLISF